MESGTSAPVLDSLDARVTELPVGGSRSRAGNPALGHFVQIAIKTLLSALVLVILRLAARHLVLSVPFMDYTCPAVAVLFFRSRARLPLLVGIPLLVPFLQVHHNQSINLHGTITVIGLAFIALMAVHTIWKSEAEHRSDAVIAPGIVLFTTGVLAALLFEAQRLPLTVDLYLYQMDGRLGFQPSFAIGQLLSKSPWLHRFVEFNYGAIPIMLIIAYAWSGRGKQLLCASAIAPILALICFVFVPAVGPKYVFPDFPQSAPAISPLPISIPISQARDCFPSMHMAWALFIYLASRKSRNLRWFGAYCALVTIVSTLGLGEHYLIDLIVAFPFALAVWYGCRYAVDDRPLSRRPLFQSVDKPQVGAETGLHT